MSGNDDHILDSTAKLLYNVFSDSYSGAFEKMLMSGGGGNSMFVNAWSKPSATFIKHRISGEAKKRLEEHGYTVGTWPRSFYRHNAKTIDKRRSAGKQVHLDHNPSNVKVLQLIRDRVRSYAEKKMTLEEKIVDLKEYLIGVQTLDLITIEQDHVRTQKDEVLKKSEKNMLTADERDALLDDTWEEIDPKNRSTY